MANWPGYHIKVFGNLEVIEEIEKILRHQTYGLYLEIDAFRDDEKTTMKISGETAWGIHDFTKIVELVEENKMDMEFGQADIYADTRFEGEWKNGKNVHWKKSNYFTEEELKCKEELKK